MGFSYYRIGDIIGYIYICHGYQDDPLHYHGMIMMVSIVSMWYLYVNSSNISNCKMVGGDIVRISWKYTRIYHEDVMRMSVN